MDFKYYEDGDMFVEVNMMKRKGLKITFTWSGDTDLAGSGGGVALQSIGSVHTLVSESNEFITIGAVFPFTCNSKCIKQYENCCCKTLRQKKKLNNSPWYIHQLKQTTVELT